LGALHCLTYGYIIRKVMEDLVLEKFAIMMNINQGVGKFTMMREEKKIWSC